MSFEEQVSKQQIFREVQFSLCEDVIQFENVKKLLLTGGAKFFNYLSDNVSHLIGDNPDHHSVSEAVEIYEKPVLTSRWVWLSAKASELLPTAGFYPFKNQLFSNIIACPSNISGPDVQSLWAMITYYGGSFRLQLESDCTHLISTKPEGLKYEKAVQTEERIKIVTPDWVIDSVKNKSLCDEDLYHPRLLIFNSQTFTSVKVEAMEVSTPSSIVVSAGTPVSSAITSMSTTLGVPQLALRTVSLPTTAMITTFSIAQTPQSSPTTVQGGRVRVFLPPQHQVRLMQMKQNQIRQLCPPVGPSGQQVVHQMIQRQALPQQLPQQQSQQQMDSHLDPNQQWNPNQQYMAQNQTTGAQNTFTSQPIQVISQSAPEMAKLRPMNSTAMSQQQPRQVYLAVQQTRPQHFIQVPQQSQQRPQSNIIIQQRGPNHNNIPSVRLQQAPQHLIQLQQRQPISLQSGAQYVRAPQQIIIQQQNQSIQRQFQMQAQQQQALQNNQSMQSQAQQQQQQTGAIPHPQVQRMPTNRMPQQFIQQNQMRGQPIRAPIGAQQIISSAMPSGLPSSLPSGQPRVFMKAQTQYSIQGQQQFDPQQQQQPQQPQQYIRGQTSGPQLQFIRGPQWTGPQGQEPTGQQHQHLASMRPQHILVTTQSGQQPTQQQIIQWQQQDSQRRQLMQQQQSQQRFQVSTGAAQDKVRPTVSVVSVSSSANTDSGATAAATSTSTVRIAQTPQTVSPNIVTLSNSQTNTSAVSVSAQVSPVSNVNTTTTASPVVNPKTKTALANLLNNRLQSGNTGLSRGDGNNSSSDGFPPNVSVTGSTGSLSLSSSTSLPNKTGFVGSPGVALPTGELVAHDSHHNQNHNQVMQIRFYGFDSRLQIPTDQCLLGCVFHLYGYEKVVETKLIELWKNKIKKMGAEVEDIYSAKCTHVLCDSYNNPFIQQCLREGKRCVSVFWLNDVLSVRRMTAPTKIYHLPLAFDDNKPCKQHIISMTGFEGEERLRVKEMISRIGAKYTNYLTQNNTILICKRLEGNKYRKSIEWRLAIVNTVWLHDVLFGQYDASQLQNIPKKYQNFDLKDSFRIEYTIVPHLMNPWRQPIRLSEEYVKSRIADRVEEKSKQNPNEELENKTSNTEKNNKSEDTEEPQTKRFKVQTEKSPVSAVTIKEEPVVSTPTNSLPTNPLPTFQTPNPEVVKNVRVLLTSVPIEMRPELRSIVLRLGGRLTNISHECTHLVTDKIARTVKFMCCFSSCKFIVTSEWITESGKQNRFVDENDYKLKDDFGEKHFGFNLDQSLSRRNCQLFKGYVFYITNGCIPSPKILKDIVESGGGQAVTTKRPTKRQMYKMSENGIKFAVITCENDLHLCDIFFTRNIDVLNVEFVLSAILKQELEFGLFSFKQNILRDN